MEDNSQSLPTETVYVGFSWKMTYFIKLLLPSIHITLWFISMPLITSFVFSIKGP